jgi:hypothetical protein
MTTAAQRRLMHHALTHAPLVPAPLGVPNRRAAPAWWVAGAAVAGLAIGFTAPAWLDLDPRALAPVSVADAAAASAAERRVGVLENELMQVRAALQLAGARSGELERQIDAVNQQLRVSQEELAFFRKARPGAAAGASR